MDIVKIRVSRTLAGAVERGQCPTQTTFVKKLTPPVRNHRDFYIDEMLPLENRGFKTGHYY
jgi:hypothetical protein